MSADCERSRWRSDKEVQDMDEELVECRTCGVVGNRARELCRPVARLDPCVDHTLGRDPTAQQPCASAREAAEYECAVCGRQALEALSICYPQRSRTSGSGASSG